MPRPYISKISMIHYGKLIFRSLLFLVTAIVYVHHRLQHSTLRFTDCNPLILSAVWGIFTVEMILRFFPSNLESMGCQKQFPKNYISTNTNGETAAEKRHHSHSRRICAAFWILLNGLIGLLYFTDKIDQGILILISLAYSVCDMICILFFCPFQTWFMKNKCCVTCQIYNWDFAMMFTPLLFIGGIWAWSLFALSLLLLMEWEVIYHRHPERFSEKINKNLSCANCQEKLCSHKKQLREFHKKLGRTKTIHHT